MMHVSVTSKSYFASDHISAIPCPNLETGMPIVQTVSAPDLCCYMLSSRKLSEHLVGPKMRCLTEWLPRTAIGCQDDEAPHSNGSDVCETCSGDGDSVEFDDDVVSLCSWCTDQGDWEPLVRKPPVGAAFRLADVASESGSDDGSHGFTKAPRSVVPPALAAMHSVFAEGNVPHGVGYSDACVSYVPFMLPMATVWQTGGCPVESGVTPDYGQWHNMAGEQVLQCQWPKQASKQQRQRERKQGGGKDRRWCQQPDQLILDPMRQQQTRPARKQPESYTTKAHSPSFAIERVATASNSDSAGETANEGQVSTLILRNLPLDIGFDALLEILDAEGFAGLYDFVHFPIDFRTNSSLGYVIVNMLDNSIAERAREHFQCFHKWGIIGGNPCEAAWNRPHQGIVTLIERYRNSPLMHDSVDESYRPAYFVGGVRAAFPSPTIRIRAPRIRHNHKANGFVEDEK